MSWGILFFFTYKIKRNGTAGGQHSTVMIQCTIPVSRITPPPPTEMDGLCKNQKENTFAAPNPPSFRRSSALPGMAAQAMLCGAAQSPQNHWGPQEPWRLPQRSAQQQHKVSHLGSSYRIGEKSEGAVCAESTWCSEVISAVSSCCVVRGYSVRRPALPPWRLTLWLDAE